jgi:DNA-binding NtrC family response regulator
MLVRVLLALRTAAARRRVIRLLPPDGVVPLELTGRIPIWNHLHDTDFDFLVVDFDRLPTPVTHAVEQIRALPDRPEVLVAVQKENSAQRASLLAAGCLAVLNLGVPDGILSETLQTLLGRRRHEPDPRLGGLRGPSTGTYPGMTSVSSLGGLAARSPAMRRLLSQARLVVGADSTVLITGETGAGKEALARALHSDSRRAHGPFVPLNCGALPEGLLETELFGHERGAFTGASRSRRGYFELSHQGTLFLDEISELPFHLQVKLLRVLEDRKVQRVGSEAPLQVDVRVIAASNRILEGEVAEKRFREDLYYRLAVVTLTVPPLRERREDIPELVHERLRQLGERTGRRILEVRPAAMEALCAYSWPGNVRELFNAIEQIVILTQGSVVDVPDLPHRIRAADPGNGDSGGGGAWPALAGPSGRVVPIDTEAPWPEARDRVLRGFERTYLENLLTATSGRIGVAAARAGLSARALYDLMRKHDLRKEDYRY